MRAQSRMLYAYALAVLFWVVSITGTVQMVHYASAAPRQAILAAALVAMTALFAVWRVSAGSIVVSVGTLVSYLTVALLGAWPAVGVKVVGLIVATLFYRDRAERPRYLIVNGAILGATTLAAGEVYLLAGGTFHGAFTARLAIPFVAMAATYTLVNVLLLSVLKWARTGNTVWGTGQDLLARFWVNEGLFALIGLIGLAVYDQLQNPGLFAVLGLLLAVRFTFQLYADAHRFRSEMAQMLAQALKFKDPYTGEHSLRVAALALRIGRAMGLPDLQLDKLHDSALLHDIGKVAIPDAVLIKPGPLNAAEQRSMARHVGAGGDLLEQSPHLKELATYIRAHHIEFDATTKDLPVEARIIAVADAFDAMTSDRPYRRALPTDEAVRRLLEGSGTQFDPLVVAALLRSLETADGQRPDGGNRPVGPEPEAAPPPEKAVADPDWDAGLQASASGDPTQPAAV